MTGENYRSIEKDNDEHISYRAESTKFQAFSTTFKCIVGSGICALPFALRSAGWACGLIGLLVVSLIGSYTMVQIVLCVQMAWDLQEKSDVERGKTGTEPSPVGFRQLGEITYGEWGRLVVDIVLLIAQIAGNCAFVAFSTTNIQSVLSPYPNITLSVVMLGMLPILIGLSLPRSTAFLAPTSHIGNIALAVGVATVFIQCGHIIYENVDSTTSMMDFLFSGLVANEGWSGFFTFLGIAAYALCSHAEVVSILNDVEDKKGYPKMLTSTMVVVCIIYLIGGFLPYLCYKGDTKSIIFLNLPPGLFVSTVKFSMAIVVMFQYPMTLVPAVRTMDELILAPFVSREPNESTSLLEKSASPNRNLHEILETGKFYWGGNVIRVTTVILTVLIAYYSSDFGILASVVGSLFGGLICFVFPALFYGKLLQLHNKWNYGYGILVVLQCLFGFGLMITGTFTAI